MNTIEILKAMTRELEDTFSTLDQRQLDDLQAQIMKADKVFVAGAGRSLLMIRGFAMRLMHMGFEAYVVGETITPAIEPGHLLIVASGSGSTDTLSAIAEKCKKVGATLSLITTRPDSKIGRIADYIVEVHAATPKGGDPNAASMQPGASTFEQSVLLIGDAMIVNIIGADSISDSNKRLMRKHANLE